MKVKHPKDWGSEEFTCVKAENSHVLRISQQSILYCCSIGVWMAYPPFEPHCKLAEPSKEGGIEYIALNPFAHVKDNVPS